MVVGAINKNHIIQHPVTIIRIFGLSRYIRILLLCLDRKTHTFLDILRMK